MKDCQVCKTVEIGKYCPECNTKTCDDLPKNFLARHAAMQRTITITNLDNNKTTEFRVNDSKVIKELLRELF